MKRYKHSLSHYKLTTCDMGQLVPVGLVEVLPGDTFQHRTSAMIRVSPLVAPTMHPVQVRIHHWFVPNRIVWDGWEDFITGENPDRIPTINNNTPATLTDHYGVPPVQDLSVNALPIRGYSMIWNEWYRDQDLQAEAGENQQGIKNVGWEKDYYTTARPWPQKGDAITLPLGTKAPVTGIGFQGDTPKAHTDALALETDGERTYSLSAGTGVDPVLQTPIIEENPENPGHPNIYADLSKAEALNVNDLRRAFALQRYQEARARYGSRYTEYLAYLGIKSSDARLQRPEYLGGGRCNISFSEVLQTGPDTQGGTDSAVGDLLGHGIATCRTRKYRRFFEEHGHVHTLMSVRPKAMYVNGMGKNWGRRDKEDYYQKELETIGQQKVENMEIFADGTTNDRDAFGYSDRYRDYRHQRSEISKEFRSVFDYWHMGRVFDTQAPVLNAGFVQCTPTKRIHAVQTNDVLWCMINHSIQARRMVNTSAHSRII